MKAVFVEKTRRSNKWELQVRCEIHSAISSCEPDLHQIKRYIDDSLKYYPHDSCGHISTSYRTDIQKDKLFIRWFNPNSEPVRVVGYVQLIDSN